MLDYANVIESGNLVIWNENSMSLLRHFKSIHRCVQFINNRVQKNNPIPGSSLPEIIPEVT